MKRNVCGVASANNVSPTPATARIRAARRWSCRRGNSRFDIFQFSFRFNPGTNGGNVEMGLIYNSYLVTLNQRVPGSSPGAPTIDFARLLSPLHQNISDQSGA